MVTVRDDHGEISLSSPTDAEPAEVTAQVQEVLARPELAAVAFHLAADHPADDVDPLPEAVADAVGFGHRRDLLQLRRPLPVPTDHPSLETSPMIQVRPIRLGPGPSSADDATTMGTDIAAWLRVNNRAFATHPEQGTETTDTLTARLDVEWDDPSGFLVADDADRPGELSGFCWTKVHAATTDDPALGEIYVIGVDPSHQGQGLGPSFVLAGLDHLATRGLAVANLYVDADNAPARRLYDRLDFTTHLRRRVYTRERS